MTITADLLDDSLTLHPSDRRYTISLLAASTLPPSIKDRIYTLFDQNMSPLSASAPPSGGGGGSSLSYTEGSKREELFDSTGRILLLARSTSPDSTAAAAVAVPTEVVDMPGAMPSPPPSSTLPAAAEDVLGYVSFRFDTEETLGSRDAEVIYWYVPPFHLYSANPLPRPKAEGCEAKGLTDGLHSYELQLDSSIRQQGLAKVLMDEMEAIGKQRGMDKAMLTCLKCMSNLSWSGSVGLMHMSRQHGSTGFLQ